MDFEEKVMQAIELAKKEGVEFDEEATSVNHGVARVWIRTEIFRLGLGIGGMNRGQQFAEKDAQNMSVKDLANKFINIWNSYNKNATLRNI